MTSARRNTVSFLPPSINNREKGSLRSFAIEDALGFEVARGNDEGRDGGKEGGEGGR